MKLINLNIYGGVVYEPLMHFIKKYSSDVEIFCFQEVFHKAPSIRPILGNARPKLFSEIQIILPDFDGHYAAPMENDVGGLVIFIKKSFTVNKVENLTLYPELSVSENESHDNYFSMGRNLQLMEFNNSGKTFSILNFHGMWIAKSKLDSDERITQSEKIRKIFNESKGGKILCTDLNVTPDTKSLAIVKEGNRDLVQEYKITSTRSSIKNRSEVVDYVIVSPDVEVKSFEVLKEVVSDHLALLMEFD